MCNCLYMVTKVDTERQKQKLRTDQKKTKDWMEW